MDHVTRIHLKTGNQNDSAEKRANLLSYCLHGEEQFLAIGWSYIYKEKIGIRSYKEYYEAVKESLKKDNKRMPAVHNVFWYVKENDLFWTRDIDGVYWICRALRGAEIKYIPELDIGAVVPVRAYKYGLEVPGRIKASFNRPNGGTSEYIKDNAIIEFTKKIYNQLSESLQYEVNSTDSNLLDNLPDFELEELVISYIQLKEDYYLLSNSIANKSTTIKIECEFIHRNRDKLKKAVVQVKGGKAKQINALDYKAYDDDGYIVYFFAPSVINRDKLNNCIVISRDELLEFYKEYKPILPDSITKWEEI